MRILALLKLQDLESFSSMFLGYDLLARQFVPYSYIYPYAELLAGVLMVAGALTWLSVPVALFIGTIGAVSVFKAVYLEKRKIKCACVGGTSKVPLGFVSLTENLMMIAMATWMALGTFEIPNKWELKGDSEWRRIKEPRTSAKSVMCLGSGDIGAHPAASRSYNSVMNRAGLIDIQRQSSFIWTAGVAPMSSCRLLGVILGLLLAMVSMAGGAYAHEPVKHNSYEAQAVVPGIGPVENSAKAASRHAAWAVAADHTPISSECSGGIDGECCAQHCCVGASAVIETCTPALAIGLLLAEKPPEAPRDLTISGLLRPPCN